MRLVPVESTAIRAIGYDPQTREMRVQFASGGIYTHADVPVIEHAKFIASPSKGSHYHQNFKNRYNVRKMEQPDG